MGCANPTPCGFHKRQAAAQVAGPAAETGAGADGAAAAARIDVRMTLGADGSTARLALAAAAGAAADIWVVFYDDIHATRVGAGENRGETLRNAHVVRSFRRIGNWSGAALERTLDLAALGGAGRDGCVLLLQGANGGPILGAAALTLPRRRS